MRYTRLSQSPEYEQAREALRVAELELMQHVHAVAAQRRALPPGPVVDDYVFLEGPRDLGAGDEPVDKVPLSELFTEPGRALIIYQLMYGKAQTEPCPMCTMWIDGYNAIAKHVERTTDFAIVAAADLPTLRGYARVRGWDQLRLLSAGDSTFKYDTGSEDEAGNQDSTLSVFTRDAEGTLRLFYQVHPRMSEDVEQRGIDMLSPVWNLLDLTPNGRPEEWYPTIDY